LQTFFVYSAIFAPASATSAPASPSVSLLLSWLAHLCYKSTLQVITGNKNNFGG